MERKIPQENFQPCYDLGNLKKIRVKKYIHSSNLIKRKNVVLHSYELTYRWRL